MPRYLFICSFTLFSFFANAQTHWTESLKDSEWWPDTIYSPGTNHMREFLYFDLEGFFYRTTWDAERYIIDRKLKPEQHLILRPDSTTWQLSQVDHERIELRGPDYYGLFRKEESREISTPMEGLNEFLVGDSIKQVILGSWQLHSLGVTPENEENAEDEEYMNYEKNRDFYYMPFDENMQINFRANNTLTVSFPAESKTFEYFIDNESLFMGEGNNNDFLRYSLKDGKLWLTEYFHPDKRTFVFVRKER